jgi:phosphate transport system protein
MMTTILHREIEKIKKQLLYIDALVEESLQKSVRAIKERDENLAKSIRMDDVEIDRLEVELEEECLKVLALHQPVAKDLRFLVALLKINNDLERIGDLASNIAGRAVYLSSKETIAIPYDFDSIASHVQRMLRKSVDALINMDADLAKTVIDMDEKVDTNHREMFLKVEKAILVHPEGMTIFFHWLSVSRYLERIADHATNIAEDVIYLISGEIIRHQNNTTF